jgi:hypothetical protein
VILASRVITKKRIARGVSFNDVTELYYLESNMYKKCFIILAKLVAILVVLTITSVQNVNHITSQLKKENLQIAITKMSHPMDFILT